MTRFSSNNDMKRRKPCLTLFAVALLFTACTGEDALTPSHADTDPFVVSAADNRPDARLRRDFHDKNGSYLLFNDTLANGELLDNGYVMTGAENNIVYTYDYLSSFNEKQNAARFIEHDLLLHLGKRLRPFSFLLVSGIHRWTRNGTSFYQNYDESDTPQLVTGVRSTAIAMKSVPSDPEERKTYAQTLLKSILSNAIVLQSGGKVDAFKAVSKDAYGGLYDGPTPTNEAENMSLMNAKGFISVHYSYGFPYFGAYPTVSEDVTAYVALALEATADAVETTYLSYPKIIEKYRLMIEVLNELGYIK